jgi:DNA-binding NtrC family response regulator
MSDAKTIVVADDDPGMIMILKHILESEGYNVISESNGAKAYTSTLQNKPNLCIFDMIMPVMSGLEVIEKLHAGDNKLVIPTILLTGSDPLEVQERTTHFEKLIFMEKPFDLDHLIRVVKDHIK